MLLNTTLYDNLDEERLTNNSSAQTAAAKTGKQKISHSQRTHSGHFYFSYDRNKDEFLEEIARRAVITPLYEIITKEYRVVRSSN